MNRVFEILILRAIDDALGYDIARRQLGEIGAIGDSATGDIAVGDYADPRFDFCRGRGGGRFALAVSDASQRTARAKFPDLCPWQRCNRRRRLFGGLFSLSRHRQILPGRRHPIAAACR